MENGTESKPSEENAAAEKTVDRNSKEAEEDAKYAAAAEDDLDKCKFRMFGLVIKVSFRVATRIYNSVLCVFCQTS